MGADLYLSSVSQKQFAKYEPLFEEWVSRRDALQAAGNLAEAEAAQQKVETYYDKMYARGYFRDSYNNSNLLWLFKSSWWVDVSGTLTDDEGLMSPENARRLLCLLQEREPVFNANLQRVKLEAGESQETTEQYFREKYQQLQAFLQEAIDIDEAIICSL